MAYRPTLSDTDKAQLVEERKAGASIKALMQRYDRSRSAVDKIIKESGGVAAGDLLAEVEAHMRRTGRSVSGTGLAAVRNRQLVPRLRKGLSVRPATAAKVRAFMATDTGPEPHPNAGLSEEAKERVIAAYELGLPVRQIGLAFGRGRNAIRRIIAEAGVLEVQRN